MKDAIKTSNENSPEKNYNERAMNGTNSFV